MGKALAIEGDGLCMTIGEPAVIVGVVTEAMVGMVTEAIEGDGLCMTIGEPAVIVGVVTEAMVGMVTEAMAGTVAGDDAISVNFGGIVVALMLAPFLSTNCNNIQTQFDV